MTVLLQTSFPDEANDIAHKIVSFRTSKGIIEDSSQLQQEGINQDVLSYLKEKAFLGNLTVLSKETVEPQVGQILKKKATQATLWALIGMLVGVITGSYSTIYQSCPIVSVWQKIFKPKKVFPR